MAFTIRHPDDGVLLDASGAELSAHVVRCQEAFAVDLSCIVTAPNETPLPSAETSVVDQLWALVADVQRLAARLPASDRAHPNAARPAAGHDA